MALSVQSCINSFFISMNRLFIIIIACLAVVVSGCSRQQRESVPAVRDYQTDAQIMAQFVDVNKSTGLYFINPNKIFSAVDYVFAYSQDELMAVSPTNRKLFLEEMDAVNNILSVMRQSPAVDAIVYSTYMSNYARTGGSEGRLIVDRKAEVPSRRAHVASLDVGGDSGVSSPSFRVSDQMTLNVGSTGKSMFYVSQINLVDDSDIDAAVIMVSGVNIPSCYGNYSISAPELTDKWVRMKGSSFIGDGIVSVSFSE